MHLLLPVCFFTIDVEQIMNKTKQIAVTPNATKSLWGNYKKYETTVEMDSLSSAIILSFTIFFIDGQFSKESLIDL